MFARTVTVQSQPGKAEETARTYRDSIVPAAREQTGFKGAFLLQDQNTGKGVSLVLWETEADMTAGEASGYLQQQIAKVAATFATPPVTEHFEVVVQA